MQTLLKIFFLPPMAIARLGSSPTPLDSFRWTSSDTPHYLADTIIEPAVSFRIKRDGSVRPYLPTAIVFKDATGAIRPVAPFFELWGRFQDEDGNTSNAPLTLSTLDKLGVSPSDIRYEITAANRKAARRTDAANCSFIAREVINGDDHKPRELRAISPHTSGQEPLVRPEKPIPLGTFHVVRPIHKTFSVNSERVDCSIMRVRFIPPKGLVYGPREADFGPASDLQPGQAEPRASQYGRIHQIVPPENRILSSHTPWSTYIMKTGKYEDPQPQDGYDGALVGNNQAWGSVDDTSDALITATLAVAGRLYCAAARVFTGPPDFAPDRRHFYSIADDLADRDLGRVAVHEKSFGEMKADVLDLFGRAFETASLFNLDAARARALAENQRKIAQHDGPFGTNEPKVGPDSMTSADTPFVNMIAALAPQQPSLFTKATPANPLPYASVVPFVHAPLQNEAALLDLLRRRPDEVRRLLRPPFGAISDLPENPAEDSAPTYRDPRVFRDLLNDMRMPPYMRDANLQPLSLTRRQYHQISDFIDLLS